VNCLDLLFKKEKPSELLCLAEAGLPFAVAPEAAQAHSGKWMGHASREKCLAA